MHVHSEIITVHLTIKVTQNMHEHKHLNAYEEHMSIITISQVVYEVNATGTGIRA